MARTMWGMGGNGEMVNTYDSVGSAIKKLVNAGQTLGNNIRNSFSATNSPSGTTSPYGGSGGSGGSGGGYSGSWSGGSASWTTPGTGYDLDLSAFETARQAMIDSANRSKGILKQRYDNLLAELANRRREGNEAFGAGRASISEDAYDRSRANMNDLASRGLSGSGLQQLGEVQERMETGQQMNDLASQYYSYLDDLEAQRAQGEQTYNEGLASIESSLEQQLANIGLQQFQAQDDYNRYMSDLAMQMASLTGPSYSYGRAGRSGSGSASGDGATTELDNNFIFAQTLASNPERMGYSNEEALSTVQSLYANAVANGDPNASNYISVINALQNQINSAQQPAQSSNNNSFFDDVRDVASGLTGYLNSIGHPAFSNTIIPAGTSIVSGYEPFGLTSVKNR